MKDARPEERPEQAAPAATTTASTPKEPGRAAPVSVAPAQRSENDWGLAPRKPRMATSIKLGLAGLLLLLCGFGYVVYNKIKNPDQTIADAGDPAASDQTDPAAQPPAANPGEEVPPQGEPGDGDPFAEAVPGRQIATRNRKIPLDADSGAMTGDEVPGQSEPLARPIPNPDSRATRAVAAGIIPTIDDEAPEATGPQDPSDPFAAPDLPSQRNVGQPQKFANEPAGRLAGVDVTETEGVPHQLDGFEPETSARARSPRLMTPEAAEPAVLDPRLRDFVPEEIASQRAASRTVVKRPAAPVLKAPPAGATAESATVTPHVARQQHPARLQGVIEVASTEVPMEESVPTLVPETTNPLPQPKRADPTPIMPRRAPTVPAISEPTRATVPRVARVVEQPTAPAGDVYTVAPHDSFWDISKKQYGTARLFMALTQYNQARVPDPQNLKPGMQIATPPRELLERRYPELFGKAPRTAPPVTTGQSAAAEAASGYFLSETGAPMYRIASGDTLSSISQRHLGRSSRSNELYELNRATLATPDALKVGAILRLPADASRLSLAPGAPERR